MKYPTEYDITVLQTTCRLGGYDVLCETLDDQTFSKDRFEVIVVDEWFKDRCDAVIDYMRDYDFDSRVVRPKDTKESVAIASGFNTGLMWASGELICFMNDHLVVPQDWLETMWDVHTKFGRTNMMHGGVIRRSPKYIKQTDDKTQMWVSLFDREFTRDIVIDFPIVETWSKRECRIGSRIDGGDTKYPIYNSNEEWFWMGMNDAAPLEACLEVNGVDEVFDGTFQGLDPDFGMRMWGNGAKLYFIDELVTEELKMRGYRNEFKESRDMKSNHDRFHFHRDAIRSGNKSLIFARNGFDIREEWMKRNAIK